MKSNEDRNKLKFAVVSSQIALELFLKYHYLKTGNEKEIIKIKNNKPIGDFKDFTVILSNFYSKRTWSFGKKKELSKLLDVRNSIVHKGIGVTSDKEISEIIVRTLFFINATSWSDFSESIFVESYYSSEIIKNELWRVGAESFVLDYYNEDATICCFCKCYTAISGDRVNFNHLGNDEELICLNCFRLVNIIDQVRLLYCYSCGDRACYIDAMNEQDYQIYHGKCVECDIRVEVRKCIFCGEFYHPSEKKEVELKGLFYCSKICSYSYYN